MLQVTKVNGCACPGDTLIYECAVPGGLGGATIWAGSALNCPSNEIVLLHRRYTEPGGTTRSCSNGATVARSLYVRNNLYISQLNTTVTQDKAQKTIICTYEAMGDPNTTHIYYMSTHSLDILSGK